MPMNTENFFVVPKWLFLARAAHSDRVANWILAIIFKDRKARTSGFQVTRAARPLRVTIATPAPVTPMPAVGR